MDILYNIPLYYISFNKNKDIEDYYKSHGFKNVNHFQAVNGKKFDPKKLLQDNIISIRCYYDLIDGRTEHQGMPGLGGIGCTMSHYTLWKHCVDNNLPYIIITEEDNKFFKRISNKDEQNIQNILSKDNSIFLGSNMRSNDNILPRFWGTQFCIIRNDTCKILIDYCFPIDVQTDSYISHLSNIGYINIDGYNLTYQKLHISSIQDVCVKCILPKGNRFYISIIILIIILSLLFVYYRHKFKKCDDDK
jgi:hypothetical protein